METTFTDKKFFKVNIITTIILVIITIICFKAGM